MKCKDCKNYLWYDHPFCGFLWDDEVDDDTECVVTLGSHKGYEVNHEVYFNIEKGELLYDL